MLVVLIAVIMDFSTGKVSNKLILFGLLIGFFIALIQKDANTLIHYLLGITLPILLLLCIFIIGGIGAGDVKLFAVIGGLIGFEATFRCILVAFLVGAVLAVVKILIQKNLFMTLKNISFYLSRIVLSKQFHVIERNSSNTIHFTLPILISVMCLIGGII